MTFMGFTTSFSGMMAARWFLGLTEAVTNPPPPPNRKKNKIIYKKKEKRNHFVVVEEGC